MYEYISVWWIVSMFILGRSNGVFWSCAEEERRWRVRPSRRRSYLWFGEANHPAVDSATVFYRIPGGICSWMWWMNCLSDPDRHPSAASFSLSTNDTTVSKVSSVPFPTSELNLLFWFFTTATAEAEAGAEKLKDFGNDLFKDIASISHLVFRSDGVETSMLLRASGYWSDKQYLLSVYVCI
jgi:hypothetical protein